LRIAILSALETTAEGSLCAALPYLGSSVLARQCEVALALGAQRIICLTQRQDPTILESQHRSEAQGIDFHIVPSSIAMVGLIAADDDLVLFADSVLVDLASIPRKLLDGRGVVSVSGEFGEAAQLERIDADRFWAGVLVVKGDIAAQLADLPKDSDVNSLLLRLALQVRTPIIALDSSRTRALLNVKDAPALAKRERQIFAAELPRRPWCGVGRALASQLVAALGPNVLVRGHWIAAGVSMMGCVLSIILSAMNYALAALVALLVAVFAANVLDAFNLVRNRLGSVGVPGSKIKYISILTDCSVVISFVLIHLFQAPVSSLLLAPIGIMALGFAAHSAARLQKPAFEALFADRMTLIAILAVSVALGHGLLAVAMITLFALGIVLFWGAGQSIRQT